jgi:predicted alpha/beta superfamily hydrolase
VAVAGASYGAIAALYTALRFPDRIGMLLLESPSLHVGEGRLQAESKAARRWPPVVYVGVGTDEGETRDAKVRTTASR